MAIKAVIDRYEGNAAFLETASGMLAVPAGLTRPLPEGSHIVISGDEVRFDEAATKAAKQRVNALLDDIFG